MALMRTQNRQGAKYTNGRHRGQKAPSMENGGLLEYFFGKDGKACLRHENFVQFLRDLHNEVCHSLSPYVHIEIFIFRSFFFLVCFFFSIFGYWDECVSIFNRYCGWSSPTMTTNHKGLYQQKILPCHWLHLPISTTLTSCSTRSTKSKPSHTLQAFKFRSRNLKNLRSCARSWNPSRWQSLAMEKSTGRWPKMISKELLPM